MKKKIKKAVAVRIKYRKRGRPRKVVVSHRPELPPIETRKYKFLGYCKCDFLITNKELLSKFIYECPQCGKKERISKLKKETKINDEKPKSKKEYLESTVQVNFSESVTPVDHSHGDIDSNNLKIQE